MPHLVIARRAEPLDWLTELPPSWWVTIHNASEAMSPEAFDSCGASIRVRPLQAAGSDAALRVEALLATLAEPTQAESDVTVFAPADPFRHAPDFLTLLQRCERFGEVQPLSIGGGTAQVLAQADRRDWIDELPVRAERHSLRTLAPLDSDDDAELRIGRAYRRKHNLTEGGHATAHFLGLLGLDDLARQAATSDIGLHAHAGLFALRAGALRQARQRLAPLLPSLRLLARADSNYPAVIERCWLHLFGLPFVSLAGLAPAPAEADLHERSMLRVVASIDAVLARSQTGTGQQAATSWTMPSIPALPQSLHQQTHIPTVAAERSPSAVDFLGAWRQLEQALNQSPTDIELLSRATELALTQGNHERAVHCARRALAVDPDHLSCLYALGMSLAATGEAEEALDVLARLADHPQAAHWQAEHADLDERLWQTLGELQTRTAPSLLGPRAISSAAPARQAA